MHWRRKWQPTPVFLPGESQGRGNLVGCRLWGHAESDTTDAMQQQHVPFSLYTYSGVELLGHRYKLQLPLLSIAKLLSKVAESIKIFYYYMKFYQPDIKLCLIVVLIFFVRSVDILCLFFTQISF